jgi:hypothetical protein
MDKYLSPLGNSRAVGTITWLIPLKKFILVRYVVENKNIFI